GSTHRLGKLLFEFFFGQIKLPKQIPVNHASKSFCEHIKRGVSRPARYDSGHVRMGTLYYSEGLRRPEEQYGIFAACGFALAGRFCEREAASGTCAISELAGSTVAAPAAPAQSTWESSDSIAAPASDSSNSADNAARAARTSFPTFGNSRRSTDN